MLTDRAGPTGFFLEGDLAEIPDAEARRMIAAGQAEAAQPERAVANAPRENRIHPTHKPPRKMTPWKTSVKTC
jgi:hypothetical protein